MATLNGTQRKHATLSTTVADTVTMSGRGYWAKVWNHHASVPLYVNLGSASSTPTSQADDTYVVGPLSYAVVVAPSDGVFKVVGNANSYSIEVGDAANPCAC